MADDRRKTGVYDRPCACSDNESGRATLPRISLSLTTALTPPSEPTLGGKMTRVSGLSAMKAAPTACTISSPSPVPTILRSSAKAVADHPHNNNVKLMKRHFIILALLSGQMGFPSSCEPSNIMALTRIRNHALD